MSSRQQLPTLQQAHNAYEQMLKKNIENTMTIATTQEKISALSQASDVAVRRIGGITKTISALTEEAQGLKATVNEHSLSIITHKHRIQQLVSQNSGVNYRMGKFYEFIIEYGRTNKQPHQFFQDMAALPNSPISDNDSAIAMSRSSSGISTISVQNAVNGHTLGAIGEVAFVVNMQGQTMPSARIKNQNNTTTTISRPRKNTVTLSTKNARAPKKSAPDSIEKPNYYNAKKRREREAKWVSGGFVDIFGLPCPPDWQDHHLLPPPEVWQANQPLPWLWMYFEGFPAYGCIDKSDPMWIDTTLPEDQLMSRYGLPKRQTRAWVLAHNQVLIDQLIINKFGPTALLGLTEEQRHLLEAVKASGESHGPLFDAAFNRDIVEAGSTTNDIPQDAMVRKQSLNTSAATRGNRPSDTYVSPYTAISGTQFSGEQKLNSGSNQSDDFWSMENMNLVGSSLDTLSTNTVCAAGSRKPVAMKTQAKDHPDMNNTMSGMNPSKKRKMMDNSDSSAMLATRTQTESSGVIPYHENSASSVQSGQISDMDTDDWSQFMNGVESGSGMDCNVDFDQYFDESYAYNDANTQQSQDVENSILTHISAFNASK